MINRKFHVEIAFPSSASDEFPLWEDVTPHVIAVESESSGRSHELDQIRAGRATVTLDNSDGRFTPGREELTVLSESFNAVGGIAVNRFAADSGVWVSDESTPLGISPTPEGVRLSGEQTSTDPVVVSIRKLDPVPVTPGQLVTIRCRVRMSSTDPAATRWAGGSMIPVDAAGNPQGFYEGIGIELRGEHGRWVEHQESFVVPPGAVAIRPGVYGEHSDATASFDFDVSLLSVSVSAPYAGQIKPGRPVRAYTVLDDNWLHYECVNPTALDLDAPRWWAEPGGSVARRWESGQARGVVGRAFDTLSDRDVFTFSANSGVGGSFLSYAHGLPGLADAVFVRAGETVTVDVEVRAAVGSPRVAVGLGVTDHAGDAVYWSPEADLTPPPGEPANWVPLTLTRTVEADSYVRMWLQTTRGSGWEFWAANLKMRLNGVGSRDAAEHGGLYPLFRMGVEKWDVRTVGRTSVAEITCVDSLTLLDAPIPSAYRGEVLARYDRFREDASLFGSQFEMLYWPCVEGVDAAYAEPLIGDARLLRVPSNPAPSIAQFTSEKTIEHSDGMTSGGFTVEDGQPSNTVGAVLRGANYGKPHIQSSQGVTVVDFWWKSPKDMAIAGNGYTLFFACGADPSQRIMSVTVESTGRIWAAYDGGRPSGYSPMHLYSPNGSIKADTVYHIGMVVKAYPADGSTVVELWINGERLATDVSMVYNPTPRPWFFMFAGVLFASSSRDFMRGTINHAVWITGTAGNIETFHSDIHPFGLDLVESESARISRVLALVGWRGPVSLDDARSELLPARWEHGTGALAVAGQAAEDASGVLFSRQAGELVYHNRHRRVTVPPRWTIREWPQENAFSLDGGLIYNDIRVTRSTGLVRTATDPESVAEYGRKQLSVKRDVNDPAEVESIALWLLAEYREARPRCETMRVDATAYGEQDAELLAFAHGATVSDKVLVTGLPVAAPSDRLSFFVETVRTSITIDGGDVLHWLTDLQISDASEVSGWIVEDEVSGVLDTVYCAPVY